VLYHAEFTVDLTKKDRSGCLSAWQCFTLMFRIGLLVDQPPARLGSASSEAGWNCESTNRIISLGFFVNHKLTVQPFHSTVIWVFQRVGALLLSRYLVVVNLSGVLMLVVLTAMVYTAVIEGESKLNAHLLAFFNSFARKDHGGAGNIKDVSTNSSS